MAQLQFSSVSPPLTMPGVGVLAARLLSFAAAMDLYPAQPPATPLDFPALLEGAKRVVDATGAGTSTWLRLQAEGSQDAQRLRDLLAGLYEEVELSPAPQAEWRPLREILGQSLLVGLLGISASSADRYESGARPTPDVVADRLHLLALTVSDLAGAYNPVGIRRWFDRPRTALGGRSPKQLLARQWSSESRAARQVRDLASSLSASPAT